MLIKNRKGFDIKIDGVRIGDDVFKNGEAFKVIAIDIDTEPSYMLNGYKDRGYSINDMDDLNIIYDATNEENMKYNLWVSRKDIKTFEEFDFKITKSSLKMLKNLYKNNIKGLTCNSICCDECPLNIKKIDCTSIVDLSSDSAPTLLKKLIVKFKKYLKEEK